MKLLRALFSDMDFFKFVILFLIVGNIGLGAYLFTQWQKKNDLLGRIDADEKMITVMIQRHDRLREMFEYLQTDKLAGEARNDLTEYVYNAALAARIPRPEKLDNQAARERNVGQVRVEERGMDISWRPEVIANRTVTGGPFPNVSGGFTQDELTTFLYYLEKNSERVKVEQILLKPFKTESGGRTASLKKEEVNEHHRWNIAKLSILLRALAPRG